MFKRHRGGGDNSLRIISNQDMYVNTYAPRSGIMANSVTVALPEANGNIYSGLDNSFYATDGPGDPPGKKKTRIIDNTKDALNHYYEDGSPVELGSDTKLALLNNKDYRRVLNRLKSGEAVNRSDNFRADLTDEIFHVGRTRVDYSTSCTSGNCTTTFNAFVRDGFRDPLDIGIEVPSMSPFGNILTPKPYNYIPYTFSVSYKNPGYPIGNNIK